MALFDKKLDIPETQTSTSGWSDKGGPEFRCVSGQEIDRFKKQTERKTRKAYLGLVKDARFLARAPEPWETLMRDFTPSKLCKTVERPGAREEMWCTRPSFW